VGVTPRRNESGAIVRRSCLSRQGKASVRPALYLAALNAFRFNAPCRALAERLLAKGMTKKAVVKGSVKSIDKLVADGEALAHGA
jgi:transposase